jgi:lipopolysaccharide export system protein LptA
MKKRWMLAALSLMALTARAEQGAPSERTIVSYDKMEVDAASQRQHASGNVTLQRGSLQLKSDSAELTQGADGMLALMMSGAPGQPASFRQKHSGGSGDLWIEGQAQQIAYDEKGGLVELKGEAQLRVLDGSHQVSRMEDSVITFDVASSRLSGRGAGGKMVVSPRAIKQ